MSFNKCKKKYLSLLMAVCLVLGMIPLTATAEADGVCNHVCGVDCTYVQGADCNHNHDTCGWDEEAQTGCAHDCEDGTCGYIEAVPCDHECDADCGGLTPADSNSPLGASGATAATTGVGIVTAGSTIAIEGQSAVSLATDLNGTGWTWDAATDTLTLDSNYTGEGIYIECGASDNITLVLNGSVTISSTAWGINVAGIVGTGNTGGSLTVKAGSNTLDVTVGADAIQANGGVFIESGTVVAMGGSIGICSYFGNVYISGSANVTATGTGQWSNGIQAAGVIINTTGTVTASGGDFSGIRADGSIQIDGGRVTVKGSQNGALNADNGIIITGGTIATDNSAGGAGGNVVGGLTVSGAAANVTVNGDITGDLNVSDGTVTVTGTVLGMTTHTGGTLNGNAPGGGTGETITYPGNGTLDAYDNLTPTIDTSLSGNSVTVNGGGADITGSVYGGWSTGTGNTDNNTVTINGGTIKDSVFGGYSQNGNSTGNSVVINGGMIAGWVVGGYSQFGNSAGNSVTISGSPDLSSAWLMGGNNGNTWQSDNNTLNFNTSGLTIHALFNFAIYNFTLPSSLSNGSTVLTVTDGNGWFGPIDIDGATVSLDFTATPSLSVSDKIILIDETGGQGITGTPTTTTVTASGYTFGIAVESGKLVATVTAVPGGGTTYTATLNITLDGAPFTSQIGGYTLKLSGNESTTASMAGSGATRTASVPNGTWKVYETMGDYTGVNITINDGPASATLDFYSESHSVTLQGAATGGTISISINGTDYGDMTYSSLSFIKGDEVVFTATGMGAVSYTYAWSGTHNGEPISGTGNTFTITSVSGIVNITCTVTGSNLPADTTPPTVTAISPSNNATGVALSGNISITFSEAIGTTGTVKLNGAAISGTSSWSGNTYTIPYSGLAYGTKYTVAISGFKDTAGNTMADSTANSFTTMADPNSGSGNGGNGGGDGGGTITTTTTTVTTEKQPNMPTVAKQNVTGTVKDNTLSFAITETMVKNAIAAATNKVDGIAVRFDLTGTGYSNISGTFNRAALEALKTAGVKYVQFTSAVLDLTLDLKTIEAILGQTTGNVTVSAVKLDKLSDAAKALIGNRPVFDITIKGANGVTVSDLKGGSATIGIPYKPTSTEKTGNLYGVYVDKNGKPQLLTNSSYDNGQVIFSRSSLSIYGVGYKTPAPAFTDTDKHRAKDDIDFVASRELISDATATTFSPDTAITRADFLTVLGKLSGADVSGYTTSSFTDVANTSAAMPYIEWAVKNKIVQGIGDNKFGPDNKITREDTAVMMVNYAKATSYTLPVSRQYAAFADDAKISAYAKDAVKAIQQAGIIVGKTGNLFDPQGSATRAEASTILRRFVELVIDEGTSRGWVQNDSGQWQYINTYGKAVTGWLDTTNGSKYWFDDKGIMAAGTWVQIEGKWYYFEASGKLAVNTTIDGYEVGADGARQ